MCRTLLLLSPSADRSCYQNHDDYYHYDDDDSDDNVDVMSMAIMTWNMNLHLLTTLVIIMMMMIREMMSRMRNEDDDMTKNRLMVTDHSKDVPEILPLNRMTKFDFPPHFLVRLMHSFPMMYNTI